MNRRTVLAGAGATAGIGWYLYSRTRPPSCEVACFEFYHEGFDDAPDWLTIVHTEGRDLPAREVFVTNVVVDYPYGGEWDIETEAWHEVDEDTGPTDGIEGAAVRVDIDRPEVVRVLWRREGDERVLDETRPYQ